MLVFLVPLKSKQVSRDWSRVSQLLERCVLSIVNQTSDNFKLVIVCHERPDIRVQHPSIDYLEVNFPPPNLGRENIINSMDRDKNKKMQKGLEYVSSINPSHIMFVDADDCVSCKIADFVNRKPHANGWVLDSGYVYEDGSNKIFYKQDRFYLMSGTSHIIRYSLLKDERLRSIYTESDSPLHQTIVDTMSKRGTPLESLPFPGAIYVVGNGENIYAGEDEYHDNVRLNSEVSIFSLIKKLSISYIRKIKIIIGTRILDDTVIREFGLNNRSSSKKNIY